MKLSNLILTTALLAALTQSSYAANTASTESKGCLAAYRTLEDTIEARAYTGFGKALVIGVAASGVLVPFQPMILAATGFSAVGAYFVFRIAEGIQEERIIAAQETIEGAYTPNHKMDTMLESVNKKLHHANLPAITEARLAEYIRSGNESGAFCPIVGFTSKNIPVYKVLTRKHIRRAVIRSILEEAKSTVAENS